MIKPNRSVDSSSVCAGCLPGNNRFPELLILRPNDSKKTLEELKAKYRKAEQERTASLKSQIPKWRIKKILNELKKAGFYAFRNEDFTCTDGYATPSFSGRSRAITIESREYTKSISVPEKCPLKRNSASNKRDQIIRVFDYIASSLRDVQISKAPWRSEIERKLRYHLDIGKLPKDFDIKIERDQGGLGSRYRIASDGIIRKASYSTRAMFKLEGIVLTSPKRKSKQPRLKKQLSGKSLRSVLLKFLDTGFFGMKRDIRPKYYVSGPARYSFVSIRLAGKRKQTKSFYVCTPKSDGEFCDLFSYVLKSVNDVRAIKERW